MDILSYNLAATSEIAAFEKERDMAEAYIRITNEQGPSQQLIDFIDYDNGLSQEIGIGMESFSTTTRHEILLSKLNPAALDAAALESLGDKIDTFAKWFTGTALTTAANLVGFSLLVGNPDLSWQLFRKDTAMGREVSKASWTNARGLLLASLAGAIVFAVNRAITGIYTHSYFEDLQKEANHLLELEEKIAATLPHDFSLVSWEKFEAFSNIEHKAATSIIEKDQDHIKLIKKRGDESGWTPQNYAAAVKWYKSFVEKLEAHEKKSEAALKKISEWLKNSEKNGDGDSKAVRKIINSSLGKSLSVFQATRHSAKMIDKVILKASKLFEAKK